MNIKSLLLTILSASRFPIIWTVICLFLVSLNSYIVFTVSAKLIDSLAKTESYYVSVKLLFILTATSLLLIAVNEVQRINKQKMNLIMERRIEEFIFELIHVNSIEKIESPEYHNDKMILNNSIARVSSYVETMLSSCQQLFSFFVYLILVSKISLLFPLVILIFSLPNAILNGKLVALIDRNLMENAQNRIKKSMYSNILTTAESIKDQLIYGAKSFFLGKWEKAFDDFTIKQKAYFKKESFLALISQGIAPIGHLIIQVILINMLFKNEITIGSYVAVTGALGFIDSSLKSILKGIQVFKDANVISSRIQGFIRKFSDEKPVGKYEIKEISSISLSNISFAYPNTNYFAIKKINIELRQGEILAFVGENGSGKSTVAKIIAGLYKYSEGQLKINEVVDLKNVNKESYFKRVAIMSQGFFKYPLTIKENIILSDSETFYAQIKMKNLRENYPFILQDRLWDNLDSEVGNQTFSSTQISGGQWQRLGVSRALLKDADLVIFDEATSEIDPITEKEILISLMKKKLNKIIIIITHNMEITKYADKILNFKNGEIIEINNADKIVT